MKKRLLILCGGRSDEHEISLISAKHVLEAVDRSKFEPLIVGIAKDGTWHLEKEDSFWEGELRADQISLNTKAPALQLPPYLVDGAGCLLVDNQKVAFDVVFPVLHGPFGEDGTLQGFFDIVGVPYVGSNCGSSWICMDKHLTKSFCLYHGIPTAPYVTLKSANELKALLPKIKGLGLPLFVKPAKMGSSVGITKVEKLESLTEAVRLALKTDDRCLIEQAIEGREIECSILGLNTKPRSSLPGEIIPTKEAGFYSYEAKYLDKESAELIVPAKLSPDLVKKVQKFAVQAYKTVECDGMARVDLFVQDSGKIYLNEINTIPGFTPISMYPKLWEASGLSYPALITELVELAFNRKGQSLES